MRIVKKDSKKAKEEEAEKIRKISDDVKRDEFLKELKENELFQKYVVEGIIKRNIAELSDNRRLEKLGVNLSNKEELADIVLQSIMASKVLNKILSELIN